MKRDINDARTLDSKLYSKIDSNLDFKLDSKMNYNIIESKNAAVPKATTKAKITESKSVKSKAKLDSKADSKTTKVKLDSKDSKTTKAKIDSKATKAKSTNIDSKVSKASKASTLDSKDTKTTKVKTDSKTDSKATKAKNLIIVESPAKARTIKTFLGNNYNVIASKGHIRDLPQHRFGINIKEGHFEPIYEIPKEDLPLVKEIENLHKGAHTTYIATDEDREGEAIGYHIVQALKGDIKDFPRIAFHEITKSAITASLQNPRTIDMDRVNAQQARRLLDRIVGFKLSGLISQKISKGLSAGRVQSSALKILVDREREIRAFKPQEYYLIEGHIESKNLIFELTKYGDKKIEKLTLRDKSEVDSILQNLRADSYKIDSINTKESVTKAKPPFMTSTLQQAASNALGFSPTRTMSIAQRLYEGVKTDSGVSGVITYMRTDSLNIAKEALASAREFIKTNFAPQYLSAKAKIYTTKQKSAQEAHEAIRPTNLAFTPQIAAKYLKDEELKLYTLIFNRFIASQMNDAIFESVSVSVKGKDSEFKINGRKLVFDGFYAIMGGSEKDKLLPNFTLGESVKFDKIIDIKKVTEAPPHFSEAGLIKTLESLGIGRPSTYAPTIKLLIERHYVENIDKKLVAQDIAFSVIEMLESNFNEIVDSGFSAALEDKLDSIAEKKNDWQRVLWDFYEPFIKQIESGKANIASQKIAKPTGEMCPQCGSELVLRNGRYGEFIACSNYPTCKYIKADSKDEAQISGEKCEKCGADMVVKMGKRGKFLACSAYPKCKNAKPLVKPKASSIKCPKCGGELLERYSKRGVFYGCSNYPKCNFLLNGEPVKKCECGGILYKPKNKKDVLTCSDCKKSIAINEG